MKCYKKRTIFDFFKYSDCKKCKYYNEDSEMHIGNVSIYLYYFNLNQIKIRIIIESKKNIHLNLRNIL